MPTMAGCLFGEQYCVCLSWAFVRSGYWQYGTALYCKQLAASALLTLRMPAAADVYGTNAIPRWPSDMHGEGPGTLGWLVAGHR